MKHLWKHLNEVPAAAAANGPGRRQRRRPTLPPRGNELQSRARGGFATMAGDRTSEPGMTVTIGIARETAPGERRVRTEEGRVGKECVSTGRYRWSLSH